MVFAFAGDSTTTTFMNPFYGAGPLRSNLAGRAINETQTLTQGNEVAGMTFDSAGEFQLEKEGGHRGG